MAAMHPDALLEAATELVHRVLRFEHPADRVVSEFFRESRALGVPERHVRGEMVVDFCAGAGGKTLALGAQMRGSGRLYAFDVSGHRLAALKPRLARSGLSNVYPVQIAHRSEERRVGKEC